MSKNPELPSNLLLHLLYGKPARHLHVDVESYCEADLTKVGHYRYWDDPSSEVMLLSYAFDDDNVVLKDIYGGEEAPDSFLRALTDPTVLKIAHNAGFERQAIMKQWGIYCDPSQWLCTMVLGMSLGLPGALGKQTAVLGTENQKGDGRKAMMYFCKPIAKPKKKDGYRTRNLPQHNWWLYHDYKQYNIDDVLAERELFKRLFKFNMQPRQWRAWAMDQRINDRGVRVDMGLIDQAIRINGIIKAELVAEAQKITGLDNPNSVTQLLKWLNDAEKEEDELNEKHHSDDWSLDATLKDENRITDLRKKTVKLLLEDKGLPDQVRRLLELRQLMAKSSVSKYAAMKRSVCCDGRIRGLLQFYGAPRTGRWAGRIVQVQNLPQNHLPDLEFIRSIVKAGDIGMLKIMFGEGILSVLSELIRTAFIPAEGKRFIIADFSAIEARLAAWDVQEDWRMAVFRTHGMIYEESAAQMFGVPWQSCVKGGPNEFLRGRGKVTELALGYQGGPNALVTMGALENGVAEDDLLPTVRIWRKKSPRLTANWYRTNDDAIECVRTGIPVVAGSPCYNREGNIQYTEDGEVVVRRYGFMMEANSLWQVLPSGRRLCYPNAHLEWDEKFEKDAVVFDGMNQYTHQWGSIRTYGGKFFENRTQANGVDNLTNAMFKIEEQDIPIVFSVHDEPVMEVDLDWKAEMAYDKFRDQALGIKRSKSAYKKSQGVVFIEELMREEQEGYEGLPLQADGMDAMVYQK